MKVFIVVEGGVVQYVSSDTPAIECEVIDLDDLHEGNDKDRKSAKKRLAEADNLGQIR